ncbi:MAG: phosphoribosylamine--glycine ligase, partial [Herpetosiphonaceae bacterium]|nr:phosphoribosylamine--glycine ligase [Herpetosiphonaceae bacterium]
LKTDLLDVMWRAATGDLRDVALEWHAGAAVCVVLAAANYPGQPRAGDQITGLDALPSEVLAFHAGTALDASGQLVTAGGRVLGITATAPDLPAARALAYRAVDQVQFAGMQLRRDIALRGIGE